MEGLGWDEGSYMLTVTQEVACKERGCPQSHFGPHTTRIVCKDCKSIMCVGCMAWHWRPAA